MSSKLSENIKLSDTLIGFKLGHFWYAPSICGIDYRKLSPMK